MVNKNSTIYKVESVIGRLKLVLVVYICRKRWDRRPIDDFPKK